MHARTEFFMLVALPRTALRRRLLQLEAVLVAGGLGAQGGGGVREHSTARSVGACTEAVSASGSNSSSGGGSSGGGSGGAPGAPVLRGGSSKARSRARRLQRLQEEAAGDAWGDYVQALRGGTLPAGPAAAPMAAPAAAASRPNPGSGGSLGGGSGSTGGSAGAALHQGLLRGGEAAGEGEEGAAWGGGHGSSGSSSSSGDSSSAAGGRARARGAGAGYGVVDARALAAACPSLLVAPLGELRGSWGALCGALAHACGPAERCELVARDPGLLLVRRGGCAVLCLCCAVLCCACVVLGGPAGEVLLVRRCG